MRRSSVIGPLILIAIGVLFLLRNFIPDFRVWDLVSRQWPFLLIGWGLLRVIEVLNWYRRGQLVPRGGMNGGEWALVIFICLIGTAVFEARNTTFFKNSRFDVAGWELIGESFDYSISGNQAGVGKTPRIVIENSRGNTRVNGIDTEEIRISGTKTIRAVSKQDADKEDKSTGLELTRSGDQYFIRTNLDRATNIRQAKADIEITVPKGAIIEARGKYGDFDIENVAGNIEIASDNAAVRMNKAGGDVRVDLRRSDLIRIQNAAGNVDLKGKGQDVELENIGGTTSVNGAYSGELKFTNLAKPFRFESSSTTLRFERIEGEVEMVLGKLVARRVTGPIQINGKSKDVELTDFTNTVEIDLERGDVHLRPNRAPLAKMSARTRSGNMELIVPPGAKLDLKGEVKRGRIENDYGDPFRVREDGRNSNIQGTIAGGPEIRLDVDRGEIRLRKWSSDEVPVDPPSPKQPPAPAAPKKALEITRQ